MMPPYWTELPFWGENPLSILHIGILAFFVHFFYKKLKTKSLGNYFFAGLCLKLAAGLGMGAVYYYYYQYGDIIQSFKIGGILADIFWENPTEYFRIVFLGEKVYIHSLIPYLDLTPRSLFFYKIASFFDLLTFHNFWIMVLYFSFLGYLAMWSCASWLAQTFGNEKAWALAFLFCPSVVVWTSGLFKENVFWIAFSILILSLKPVLQKYHFLKKWYFYLFLPCFWLIFQLKYYYFAVLAPLWLSLVISLGFMGENTHKGEKEKFYFLKKWNFLVIFLLLIFAATFLHPNLRLTTFLQSLETNYYHVLENTQAHNRIDFDLPFSWFSLFVQSHKALISIWLRPFLWEEGNFLKKLVALENTVLIGLFLAGILKKMKAKKREIPFFEKMVFLKNNELFLQAVVLYILILSFLLPFSAPNIGSLVRYKISFFPFLVYFLSFWWFEKRQFSKKIA